VTDTPQGLFVCVHNAGRSQMAAALLDHHKHLTDAEVRAADVVVTMGCGDACPVHPGTRQEDWELQDPAGQPVEVVRGIRDQIDARVRQLLARLVPARATRR
jgi:arsenate reductase